MANEADAFILERPAENKALGRIGRILEHLGLAMMIGGMLALGAFVAPAIFGNLDIVQAGKVMTLIFMRHDNILLASVVMVVVGELLQLMGHAVRGGRLYRIIRYVLVITITVITIFSVFVLHPQIEAYQQAGVSRGVGEEGKQMDQLHETSETLYKLNLGLSTGLLILLVL